MFLSPRLTTKAKEKALINNFVGNHDLICMCNEPAFHCLKILINQLQPELSTENKNQLIKCLGSTTTEEGNGEKEDHGLEDLEKLFAEDPTGDDTG